MKIASISAGQIFDSRGHPTVKAFIQPLPQAAEP